VRAVLHVLGSGRGQRSGMGAADVEVQRGEAVAEERLVETHAGIS
jgi:hypothetical protein